MISIAYRYDLLKSYILYLQWFELLDREFWIMKSEGNSLNDFVMIIIVAIRVIKVWLNLIEYYKRLRVLFIHWFNYWFS